MLKSNQYEVIYDPLTREAIPEPKSQQKCSSKVKLLLICTVLSLITAICVVVAIVASKHSNQSYTISHAVPKSVATKLDSSSTKFICTNSSQCSDKVINGEDIFCFGIGTCSQSELISSSPSGSINCISEQACQSSELLIATGTNASINCVGDKSCMDVINGVTTFGHLDCVGMQSCFNLGVVNAKTMHCSGDESCSSHVIGHGPAQHRISEYHADILNCTGKWSCTNAVIYAKALHVSSDTYPMDGSQIMAINQDNVSVHLHSNSSGAFAVLHCRDQATCNVHCYEYESCADMDVYVHSNGTTLNIECDDDDMICPNVWYIESAMMQNEENVNGHQFDNTMVFKDNNGFNLNDEMFDVGRDWVLNGNFNMNLVIQNFDGDKDGNLTSFFNASLDDFIQAPAEAVDSNI